MKISASVPDDLWSAASKGEDSTSKVVQDALELLVERRRGSEERIVSGEARVLANYTSRVEGSEVLDKLEAEARELQRNGYWIGIELAETVGWRKLERLPSDIASALVDWTTDTTLWDNIFDPLFNLFEQYEVGLHDNELDPSLVLYEAIAAGLADTRDAIRDRLRDPKRGS